MDMNLYSKICLHIAKIRGKVTDTHSPIDFIADIREEFQELLNSSASVESEHLKGCSQTGFKYTEYHEELADVIITCMSALAAEGVNVDVLLEAKIRYNKRRKD